MRRPLVPAAFLAAFAAHVAVATSPAAAEPYVWIDENGVTQLTNDPSRAPEAAGAERIDELRSLWGGKVDGPPLTTPVGSSGSADDRVVRQLRGVAGDLERGEHARAGATLRNLLRIAPARPEPHWYLAQLEGRRGRYASAAEHLRSFLSSAGEEYGPWRAQAQQRLAQLAAEEELADTSRARGALRLVDRESPHFRAQLDAELEEQPAYASTVLGFLEQARSDVSEQLGVAPLEPLGVVFYGRAAYLQAHAHRFSFQTVGFFDGRIHVSATAAPAQELRSLLYHEYTHAVFREQTGGDRPYWLNEGLAELVERRSRKQPTSTRSERASLRTRINAGSWLPLRRLAPSFSGLVDADARAAYLQSIVAAEWIEEHTDLAERERMLARIGEGWSADQALHEAMGVDTDALDAAVRRAILDEFPALHSRKD